MSSSDTLFNVYWLALIASGIIMLAIAGTGFGGLAAGQRALNGIFGAAFLGYGLYLGFFFDSGRYWIFFKAFIVPVLLIANAIRNAVKQRQPAQPQPPAMQGYQTQSYPPQPYPGQPYPGQAHPSQAYLGQANTTGQRPPTGRHQQPVAPYQPPAQPQWAPAAPYQPPAQPQPPMPPYQSPVQSQQQPAAPYQPPYQSPIQPG